MSPRLRFGGTSDVGMQRHNNQDSMYAGPALIAVADGVGGAVGGEVASRLTITAVATLDGEVVTDPRSALVDAANSADASIRQTIARDPSLAGMSTTLTAILATDDQLTLGHIGDSRAYLLRGGTLSQLSHDHTFVQSLIDDGQITEEQALTHPRRSWIMRALDGRGQPELDLIPIDAEPGDRYLVCSDGLSSYVSEADIATGLTGDDPQTAADRLVDLALRAGGPDNVTCVVADPVDDEAIETPPLVGGAVAEAESAPVDADATPAAGRSSRADSTGSADGSKRRSIGRRLAAVAALVVILIAAGVAGVVVYVHHQWYVAPSAGNVAVFQGVQGTAAGIQLSHLHALTDIPVTALPQDDRDRVTSGIQTSGGQAGASDVVTNLRNEACALATPSPQPAATTAAERKAQRKQAAAQPTVPPPAWCVGTS